MVTKSSVVAMQPRSAVAKVQPVSGAALINQALDDDSMQAIVDADRFRLQVQRIQKNPVQFDQVKVLHSSWLPNIVAAHWAHSFLCDITCFTGSMRSQQLTQAHAATMLEYLSEVMSKRRNDEVSVKLLACADIFSPTSNAIGPALGLWELAPMHPMILAIAIKQLMAEKTFEPSEAELREALDKVKKQLSLLTRWIWMWLEQLDRWDAQIFKQDRAAWDAAYANVGSNVPLWMQEQAEVREKAQELSPRWQALNDLWETKQAAEEGSDK